jgi:hypothetical protein
VRYWAAGTPPPDFANARAFAERERNSPGIGHESART